MFYVDLGFRHITDWAGADHMLFLLALTLPMTWKDWRVLIRWVTAFTVGHSLTLAFAALEWVAVPSNWVEFAIAATIAATGILHLFAHFKLPKHGWIISLIFGGIHGLGFGSYYAFISQSESFWWAWIPFNLGIELGQLAVVAVLIFVYSVAVNLAFLKKGYKWLLLGVVLTVSFQMMVDRFNF